MGMDGQNPRPVFYKQSDQKFRMALNRPGTEACLGTGTDGSFPGNGNGGDMKYIMKNCGCIISKTELTEHKTCGYRCPNHPGNGIDYVEKKCIDCPCIMRLSPKQTTAKRCPECREKIQKERNKSAYKKRRHRVKPDKDKEVKAAVDAYDCVYRDECMKEAIKVNAETLPCYACDRYVSAFSLDVNNAAAEITY